MDDLISLTETISTMGIWAYLLAINLITFVLFAVDKLKAKADAWRISEKTLLACSLLGGALGGMIAMQMFRHKTQTPIFKYGLPVMILLHLICIKSILFI